MVLVTPRPAAILLWLTRLGCAQGVQLPAQVVHERLEPVIDNRSGHGRLDCRHQLRPQVFHQCD